MRVLFRILCLVLLSLSLSFVTVAAQEEKTYFVRFSESAAVLLSQDTEDIHLLTETELAECLAAGTVEWYEEDYEVFLLEDADYSAEQWNLQTVSAARADTLGCAGQTVTVGVIDSGANPHPDLAANLAAGYDFLAQTEDVTDNVGHGTFVSGLIAAEKNGVGINGIAPQVEIVPLKCFDSGVNAKVSTIKEAIHAAVDTYGCDVINMSFGMTQYSTVLEEAVQYAIGKGVSVVASVGNKGTEVVYYPAGCANVIGVGSVDEDGTVSYFSQYNESVFLTAPGNAVLSTLAEGGYGTKKGTSFSAPHVTGAIAVLLSIDETLTVTQIRDILAASAAPEAGTEEDPAYDVEYGYGILDIGAAIDCLLADDPYFLSPLTVSAKTTAVLYNNTDAPISGVCLWGNYAGAIMKAAEGYAVSLAPGEVLPVESSFNTETVKCFFWQGIDSVTAFTHARERKVTT